MFGGQRGQFADQFRVLSVQIDLVDDLAHAAHGPELFDEGLRVIGGFLDELAREVERLFGSIHFTRQA